MKNDETTCYYESVFAAHMADFIRYKRAQGLKYDAVPRSLRSFSRFLSAKEADDASIGKEMIEEWCSFRPNENRLTQRRRIVETTPIPEILVRKRRVCAFASSYAELASKRSVCPAYFLP